MLYHKKIKLQAYAYIFCLMLTVSCEDKQEQADNDPYFNPLEQGYSLPTCTMDLAGEEFTVELAYTRASRTRGLMFRRQLASQAGMLFIFEKSQPRSFYMKNCLIDLDILFIKPDGAISNITTMKVPVPGEKLKYYESTQPVKYALELPADTAQRLNLKPGQKIQIPPRVANIIPDPE